MAKMMPFNELLDLIDENPISGAQEAQKRNESVRVWNYQSSVSAGALYRRLKGSPALISGFYGLPFWGSDDDKKSYTRNPKHLNKHCHQFVYGARDGAEGKRAEDHAFATQEYLDDESKDIDGLLDALKNGGGFQGLRQAAPAGRHRNAQARQSGGESVRSGQTNNNNETGDEEAVAAASAQQNANTGAGVTPKASWPKMSKEEIFKRLLVDMEPDELEQFLPANSEVGDEYLIAVRRVSDLRKIAIWRATEITGVTA